MKLQLDTTNKTIKLESTVKISEFLKVIKRLLPNNEWKDFELETNVTIQNWSNPIIIERPSFPRPYEWYMSETTGEWFFQCRG